LDIYEVSVLSLHERLLGPQFQHPQHRIYPYLRRVLSITRPNQVWCSDTSNIPVKRGFLYLVAIMDRAIRKILSWRLSNTLDTSFGVEALEQARVRYGKPEILNTDHPSHGLQANHCRATGQPIHRRWLDHDFDQGLHQNINASR